MVCISSLRIVILSAGLCLIIVHAAPSDSSYYTSASSSTFYLGSGTTQTSFASSSSNGTPTEDNARSTLPPLIHHSGDDNHAWGEPGIGSPEDDDATTLPKQNFSKKSTQRKRQASLTSEELQMKQQLEAFNHDHPVMPRRPAPYGDVDPQLLENDGGGSFSASLLSRVPTYTLGDHTGITPDTFRAPLTVEEQYLEGWLSKPQAAGEPYEEDDMLSSVDEDSGSLYDEPMSISTEQVPIKETSTAIPIEPARRLRAKKILGFYVCKFIKPDGKECSKAHNTQAALNHHQKNHGPKDFICKEVNCESRFSVRDQLAKHQRTVHATMNKYNCQACGEHTNRRDVWNKHIKTEKHKQKVRGNPIIHQTE